MSAVARAALVAHPSLLLRTAVQKSDLLDVDLTQTELIAYLLYMVDHGHVLEVTAVRTDHDNDACLGRHSHANGFAIDCWFNASKTLGDYLDQGDPRFIAALEDAAKCPWNYQVGLGGAADAPADWAAAGPTVFEDNGEDHVHLGADG